MTRDLNNNGIPDDVEVAAAKAAKAREDAKKAAADLERARLPYQVPLYDRVIMRLVVPFVLTLAAPGATYYFSQKASTGLDHVEQLDRAVERLERFIIEREVRERLSNTDPLVLKQDAFNTPPPKAVAKIADDFMEQQEVSNLDDYLDKVQARDRIRALQEQH